MSLIKFNELLGYSVYHPNKSELSRLLIPCFSYSFIMSTLFCRGEISQYNMTKNDFIKGNVVHTLSGKS